MNDFVAFVCLLLLYCEAEGGQSSCAPELLCGAEESLCYGGKLMLQASHNGLGSRV
jgi:hypothetical protein